MPCDLSCMCWTYTVVLLLLIRPFFSSLKGSTVALLASGVPLFSMRAPLWLESRRSGFGVNKPTRSALARRGFGVLVRGGSYSVCTKVCGEVRPPGRCFPVWQKVSLFESLHKSPRTVFRTSHVARLKPQVAISRTPFRALPGWGCADCFWIDLNIH